MNMRQRLLVAAVMALPAPVAAAAAGLELAGWAGPVIPVYKESLRLDPSGLVLPGGASVPAGQTLQLDATGGFSLGGAATVYLADAVGIEVRLDTADLDVQSNGVSYPVEFRAGVLTGARGALELGRGPMAIDRVRPLSVNLKLRTPGRVRLALSGGVSYLPELRFVSAQAVRFTVTELAGVPTRVELASLGLQAEALATEQDTGKLGANAGLGLQIRLGRTLSLVGEGRGFLFQRHRLHWRRTAGTLSSLETTLADELERRLDPLDFNPTFFQATAGLALSF